MSELAYIISPQYWGQRYGTEAVAAVVNGFAPTLIKQGYPVEGQPIKGVCMTVSNENVASQIIALSAGFTPRKIVNRFGKVKLGYTTSYEEILNGVQLRQEKGWVEAFTQKVRQYPELQSEEEG